MHVPHFEGVRIHSGNVDSHTMGCILVGVYKEDQPDFVADSRVTFSKLFEKIEKEMSLHKVLIEINGGPVG